MLSRSEISKGNKGMCPTSFLGCSYVIRRYADYEAEQIFMAHFDQICPENRPLIWTFKWTNASKKLAGNSECSNADHLRNFQHCPQILFSYKNMRVCSNFLKLMPHSHCQLNQLFAQGLLIGQSNKFSYVSG